MKKLILFVIITILSSTLVEAAVTSINVSWQLSTSVLRPSSIATLYVTISNPGADLTGVVVKATSGPYLTIQSGGETDVGAISSLQSSQSAISLKVDDNAPSTSSYVYLEINYYTSTSSYQRDIYIPILIIRTPELQIKNVNFSDDLEPGKTITLSFDLKNEGLGTAKDIILSLDQSTTFIVPQSSGEFFINNLASSNSEKLSFQLTVSPDASIGTAVIPIRLSYNDETRSNNYTDIKEIGALITGKYNFIVTVESQDVLTSGTSGSMTVKIANAGTEQANYLAVKVVSPSNFDLSPTTIYIGNLKSDDYDTEKLLLKIGSVDPGDYPISLQVSYKDSFGRSYNEVYSINAKVYSKAEYSLAHQVQSPYTMIIVIVVIIIIVFFIAYKKGYLKRLFGRK